MDDASRIFWLKYSFDHSSNDDTLLVPTLVPSGRRLETKELFFEFYDAIREWVEGRRHSGLAVVALDDDGIYAKAYLRAHENKINTAIIGRHEKADICLGTDPVLSLRHVAVLVSAEPATRPLSFRVVDLRTAAGFTDERGSRLRACESSAPCFLRCGRYSLLFAPLGGVASDATGWPTTPEVMWEMFRGNDATSLALPHPATLEDGLLSRDEEALGELVISSEEGHATMLVGRRAARLGILLGRSERCDGGSLLGNPHISRVHALIVELAGRLYVIDTASKNGVWGKGGEERAQLLESGTTFSLCGLATVEWRFFH